jgi:hypothetical protein
MRVTRFAPFAVVALVAACATAPTREPVTTVPAGTYLQVDPEPEAYTAVAINEGAFTVRVGDEVWSGQHWLDGQGRYHMADDTGPCAGMESIWTYDFQGTRVTMDLVSDECATREFPATVVFEEMM